jgi:recombination protein RecR
MRGDGAQHRPDEAVRRPARERNRAAGPGHAYELGRCPLVVGGEHRADDRCRRVKGAVRKRELLHVPEPERDLEPLGGGALEAPVEERRNVVDRRHLAAEAGGGNRHVAAAAGDVEHARAGAEIRRVGEVLRDGDDQRRDLGVVPARRAVRDHGSADAARSGAGRARAQARRRRLGTCPFRVGGQNEPVLTPSVENLVAQLTRLPGVGQRTAQRLAFHILQRPADEALALAAALAEVKERVQFCRECGNLTEDETCAICLDARRDHAMICVVEQPVDVVSLERTHEYRGLYHVLGGALSPIDGVEPSDLRIDELIRRVDANGVREVVLATNPTMTGEATAAYLADRLRDRVRVTRLASGLPVGGDLEYADEVTLGRALAGRREM